MSSQGHHKTKLRTVAPKSANQCFIDEIDLTDHFSDQMARLCMCQDYSDVEFIIEKEHLPAHRVILAARSEYFRALLYGGLAETTQREIHLQVPLDAFKALLKYIYSGHLSLLSLDEDAIIDILGLANQYGFQDLETAISKYLRQYLALGNVCAILDAARLYNLEELMKACLLFMDRNASELLQQDSFRQLSKESLEEVLRRDCFFAPEVQIFLGVWKWCTSNPEVDIKSVVSNVRLPLMNLDHLLQVVRPSGILEPNKLLDAIEEQSTSKNLPYRAALWPEENVATSKHHARCIQGACRTALLDGDVTTYDMERGYTRHSITETDDSSIIVELGTMCMINHIRMLLWDRDSRAYCYYVEVSGNQIHWDRVVDYSAYFCRSWQHLYFDACPVRYIRLVGTQNTVNKVFHVVSLEAMYTVKVPKVIDGIVAPTENVATIQMSAVVTDGVSRTRNALINGDYVKYDWDSGYTCHQLGSGEIVVRLGQPYYVGTMRLLLWDCDDRSYSFYIETSTNQKDWQMIVDKRNENARSWQNFSFKPRPVVFIRIVGTRNTANEIFHCVHLECPSQDASFLQQLKEKEPQQPLNTVETCKRKINGVGDYTSSTGEAVAIAAAEPTTSAGNPSSSSAASAASTSGSAAAGTNIRRNIRLSSESDAFIDLLSANELSELQRVYSSMVISQPNPPQSQQQQQQQPPHISDDDDDDEYNSAGEPAAAAAAAVFGQQHNRNNNNSNNGEGDRVNARNNESL